MSLIKFQPIFLEQNLFSIKQFRDKGHHLDVFPNIKIPKTFDLEYVKSLGQNSRLEYVLDRSKLPEKTVFDIQMQASKFFNTNKAFSWLFRT